jgi:hypothetical protein
VGTVKSPVHEDGLTCQSFIILVSLISAAFSAQFFTSSVKFIPKNFILPDTIVDEIVFLIPFEIVHY